MDGDGDLDAWVVNGNKPNRVWVNERAGVYSDSGQRLGISSGVSVSLGNVDGEGDLDASVANYGAGNEVWVNDDHPICCLI